MSLVLPRYPLTFIAVVVLDLSFMVLKLGGAEAIPTDGFWRVLVLPAWLTLLVGAVIRTALRAVVSLPYIVFLLIGILVWLAPFVVADRVLGTRRPRRATAT